MKFPKPTEAIAYKKLRMDAGLSATEAAAILNITPETLSRRENGKTTITREAALAMESVCLEAHKATWSYLASLCEPQATRPKQELQAPMPKQEPQAPKPEPKQKPWRIDPLDALAGNPQNSPYFEPQERNALCNCGSGIKFKKCCGR